ncbi:TAXI family TRAP transporter solute-binding subunit [Candidatus Uabimicrobium amorphum]|uniref:C4-dicarboxylate ABC transporter substrate-binding protein n=1 Tax=Uabimicrobium amorphum TaxID=2596890 RepID=A0A5S9F6I4_UABAM|nr:TAXI family TRAP transporter solute-binding subunit [Candidatus Uabimicrobium amorphum]BBM87728.1 C4-dicarboxylate ABC transporter substrate-binding protein [Candidatus Uabimicrobium amorphum]
MKRMMTLLLLLPMLFASERYVYIQSIEITKKNAAGKSWDGFYGKPDILLSISVWQNSQWLTIFESKKFKDTFAVQKGFPTRISIAAKQKIRMEVFDNDLQKNDLVGRHEFVVDAEVLSGKEQTLSFGRVTKLVYHTLPYKDDEDRDAYSRKQRLKIQAYEEQLAAKNKLIQKYKREIKDLQEVIKQYQLLGEKYGIDEIKDLHRDVVEFSSENATNEFHKYTPYRDITSLFELQYPHSWSVTNDIMPSAFSTKFQAKKMESIEVHVTLGDETATSVLEEYKRKLPSFLNNAPLSREKSHRVESWNDTQLVVGHFTTEDKAQNWRALFYKQNAVQFFIRVNLTAEHEHIWHHLRKTLRFFPEKFIAKRKDTPMSTADVVKLAKKATVLVHANYGKKRGTGTGWFIHPAGYIITNHHVCFDHKDDYKQAKELHISWDSGVANQKVRAKLVAAWYQEKPVHKDIALLKIEGGNYPYLPMANPQNTIESDRILTLGFPRTDVFGSSDITITEGTIIRLVENPYGKLDVIYIDAQITSGNSGGPCYDLNLGGVIGINTAIHTGSLHGYNITLPVSIAVEEFPEVFYPSNRKLQMADHYKLASYYASRKWYRGASREFFHLTRLQPKNDLFWALLGQTSLKNAVLKNKVKAVAYLKKALEINAKNRIALETLGKYYANEKDNKNAFLHYNHLIHFYPKNANAYIHRAKLLVEAQRYKEAIHDAKIALELHESPEPHALLGKIYYLQQKFVEGQEQYKKALAINQRFITADLGRVAYYLYTRAYTTAEAEYSLLLKKYPENVQMELEVAKFYYAHKKNKAKALRHYQQVLAIYKKRKMTPDLYVLRAIAQLAYSLQEYNIALNAYIARLSLEVDNDGKFDTYVGLGNVYLKTKQYAYSDAYYCLAFATNPKDKVLKKFLQGKKLEPLSVPLLNKLIFTQPARVVARIIMVANLNFTYSNEQIYKMSAKLPVDIYNALLLRAKNKWLPIRPQIKSRVKINDHLLKNCVVKAMKFYPKNNKWYVDFRFTNNNSVAVTKIKINANLQNQAKKTIKVVFIDPKETIQPGETKEYTQVFLVPFIKYAHVRFVYLKIYNLQQTKATKPVAPKTQLHLAVGSAQGTYYQKGLSIQQLLAKDQIEVVLRESPGAFRNLLSIANNEVDIAFTQFDSWLATAIDKQLKKKIEQVAIITPVGTEEIHILVRKDAKVQRLQDLQDKTVHLGADTSGTSITAGILLNMAGVDINSITADYSSPQKAVEKLLSGEIDAMFYTVGAPAELFKNIDQSYRDHIALLEISPDFIASIQKKSTGIYGTTVIAAGTYPWLTKDTVVLNTLSLLITHRSQSSTMIKKVFDLILENKDFLQKSHASWGKIDKHLLQRIPEYYLHDGVK